MPAPSVLAMPARDYAGYGSALRIAAAVSLSEYDRQTLCAFIADLFRREVSDVERDLANMPEPRRRKLPEGLRWTL